MENVVKLEDLHSFIFEGKHSFQAQQYLIQSIQRIDNYLTLNQEPQIFFVDSDCSHPLQSVHLLQIETPVNKTYGNVTVLKGAGVESKIRTFALSGTSLHAFELLLVSILQVEQLQTGSICSQFLVQTVHVF